MVTIAQYPASRLVPHPTDRKPPAPAVMPASGAAARALARYYLRYVSALWRGDEAAAPFATWLDRFWQTELPPAPDAVPNAISPHGCGGHGIAWYEVAGEIRGYAGGAAGGYRVPISALPEAAALTIGAPRRDHD